VVTSLTTAAPGTQTRFVGLRLDHATQTQLDGLVANLHSEFDEILSPETVDAYVAAATEGMGTARFGDFLPLLVYRSAREELRAYGQATGKIAKLMPEVLFVTLTDTGRGQIAAALLERHAGGRVSGRAAGTAAERDLNPLVVDALAEIEVDMSMRHPKPITEDVLRAADVVVSFGEQDVEVPELTRHEVWDVEDPRGKDLDAVRTIRDDIDARVQKLIGELVPTDEPTEN
jgi:arsenate reductase (thioredoxin)